MKHVCLELREPLLELVFLFIPLRWRFAARAVCRHLRGKIDTQAARLIGLLRPSALGSYVSHNAIGRRVCTSNVALRPVFELDSEDLKAVTCMCFGQQRLHRAYVVLAVASRNGHARVYRCCRNKMELRLMSDPDLVTKIPMDNGVPADPHPDCNVTGLTLLSLLVGHSRAITSVHFYGEFEDQLITASMDKTLRFWNIIGGTTLKVFRDCSPITAAICLPQKPDILVSANKAGKIRLLGCSGLAVHKLKFEATSYTTALASDDTGLILFAGTRDGRVRVVETSDEALHVLFEICLGQICVTCITFAPAGNGLPARLVLNATDSTIKILDCAYDPATKSRIVDIVVNHCVTVPHTLFGISLPFKSCYTSCGGGYVVSGSEDSRVCIYSMAGGFNSRVQHLEYHTVPVVSVAINHENTLLVTADALGRLVLWRRMYV